MLLCLHWSHYFFDKVQGHVYDYTFHSIMIKRKCLNSFTFNMFSSIKVQVVTTHNSTQPSYELFIEVKVKQSSTLQFARKGVTLKMYSP